MADYMNPILAAGGQPDGLFQNSGGDDGTWEWEAWWANHNSGSHSEMEIKGKNLSGREFNYVMVRVTFIGNGEIYEEPAVTRCTSSSLSGNTLTIIFDGHVNPGENVSFGIPDIKFTNPQYKKWDNVSGTFVNVSNCSYYETSDSQHCNCIATEFKVSYYYSI